MAYQAQKGTRDVLPKESYRWQYLEDTIRGIVKKYGFEEVRTPTFEQTDLFLRGVGQTTDIVQKEMYTFLDKGGRSITLKPEGTAGVVRMFVEHGLFSDAQPTKMYYLYNPVFRYERPQAGRLREHHQFGVEMFGAENPSADAEVIAIAAEIFGTMGATDLTVRLNSIGCPNCRPAYQKALRAYLETHRGELCETCLERMENNPLRVLDCKVDTCRRLVENAPHTEDYLCEECRTHLDGLREYLDLMGMRYQMDPLLVRGLDYYTKTVFEIVSDRIGAQSALCGGGRYDGLVRELGGPDMPAVGFGLGMERLLLLLDQLGVEVEKPVRYDLMLLSVDAASQKKAFALAHALRALGLLVDVDHMGRGLKAQMKYADRQSAARVMVLGEEEWNQGKAMLKDMHTGEQTQTSLDPDAILTLMK